MSHGLKSTTNKNHQQKDLAANSSSSQKSNNHHHRHPNHAKESTSRSLNDNSNPQQGTGGQNRTQPTTTTQPVNHHGTPSSVVATDMATAPPPSDASNAGATGSVTHARPRVALMVPPNVKDVRKLFVGGLPSDVTCDEFRSFFEGYGKVLDSVVMYDRVTSNSRGFGFVTFSDEADSNRLLQLRRVEMRGKMVEIKSAQPKTAIATNNPFPLDNNNTSNNHHNNNNIPLYSPSRSSNKDAFPPGGYDPNLNSLSMLSMVTTPPRSPHSALFVPPATGLGGATMEMMTPTTFPPTPPPLPLSNVPSGAGVPFAPVGHPFCPAPVTAPLVHAPGGPAPIGPLTGTYYPTHLPPYGPYYPGPTTSPPSVPYAAPFVSSGGNSPMNNGAYSEGNYMPVYYPDGATYYHPPPPPAQPESTILPSSGDAAGTPWFMSGSNNSGSMTSHQTTPNNASTEHAPVS